MQTRINKLLRRLLFLVLLVPLIIIIMAPVLLLPVAILNLLFVFITGGDDFMPPEWCFVMLEKTNKITDWILNLI